MTARDADGTSETLACLIIDDPMLRPNYGCFNYEELLQEMKAHRFFTEIAFIPWNYKRSNPKTVRLFAENPDHFALCVHGCNHTLDEFAISDYQQLSALSHTALWRMEEHKRLTGLAYDPVMVFPHDHYSCEAMRALKDQGFLAAVSCHLQATDGETPPASECQLPATRMYHGLPLLQRRYPSERSQFVEDVAAGRPIIVVEHHHLFRNGYGAITELVDWINDLGNVRWTSLATIAEQYAGTRAAPIGPLDVPPPLPGPSNARVALRRHLCEARDDYVETSPLLTKAYRTLRRGTET